MNDFYIGRIIKDLTKLEERNTRLLLVKVVKVDDKLRVTVNLVRDATRVLNWSASRFTTCKKRRSERNKTKVLESSVLVQIYLEVQMLYLKI